MHGVKMKKALPAGGGRPLPPKPVAGQLLDFLKVLLSVCLSKMKRFSLILFVLPHIRAQYHFASAALLLT